jgi:hypothetical protein
MVTPKSKKRTYEIMLTSTQIHRVRVDAESPEAACKLLQRKTKHSSPSESSLDIASMQETWSDPSEAGEAWMVLPLGAAKDVSTIMVWDGKSIRTRKLEKEMRKSFTTSKKSK